MFIKQVSSSKKKPSNIEIETVLELVKDMRSRKATLDEDLHNLEKSIEILSGQSLGQADQEAFTAIESTLKEIQTEYEKVNWDYVQLDSRFPGKKSPQDLAAALSLHALATAGPGSAASCSFSPRSLSTTAILQQLAAQSADFSPVENLKKRCHILSSKLAMLEKFKDHCWERGNHSLLIMENPDQYLQKVGLQRSVWQDALKSAVACTDNFKLLQTEAAALYKCSLSAGDRRALQGCEKDMATARGRLLEFINCARVEVAKRALIIKDYQEQETEETLETDDSLAPM